MGEIIFGIYDDMRNQIENACIIPSTVNPKVYEERLDNLASAVYRSLRTNIAWGKYPVEIIVLSHRPTGRYCIFSDTDEIRERITKQRISICPHYIVCPYPKNRTGSGRAYDDMHWISKSAECRAAKGDIEQMSLFEGQVRE